MAAEKKIHLLCNAHLDPVWLWEWEEGAAEALSTFRTAAELCERDEAFVFNHNEAILYRWVAEYEPVLFRRIQQLVKRGRWHIMGGWYLQPDCNMPCGESFVRQILLGKSYFKEHFGVDVKTAINFDPFGHTRGLVQILARAGYDSYLFGRPDQSDCPLPADEFLWVGYDGSEVMATRFCGWYLSKLGEARQKIERWIEELGYKQNRLILWGVGDHGGGPSKHDLREVNRLIARTKDYRIVHSTPESFFREVKRRRSRLPRHAGDLNAWGVGCYTSQIRIKQAVRKLENELYAVEKMAACAYVQGRMRYPSDELQEALRDLLTGQFHDILPGSSIQRVEETSLRLLHHGQEIVSRIKARAFFALSHGQRRARAGETPIMVYNPHPYRLRQAVEVEFNLPDFSDLGEFHRVHVYHSKKRVPSQVEKELSNVPVDWRKRVVFLADLEPCQMNRFDCRLEKTERRPQPSLKAKGGRLVFRTAQVRIVVNARTGLIDSYRVAGTEYLGRAAFEPLVIRDNADSWGMLTQHLNEVVDRFRLMTRREGSRYSGIEGRTIDSVRVIEDGEVRTVVEVVLRHGSSTICQRYKLPKVGTEIEVETRVLWGEKDRMLKLSLPLPFRRRKLLGQVAYGVEELPAGGKEVVAQKWVAVVDRDRDRILTCIDDGIYGCDLSSEGLRLTLLRSAAYSCHPWEGKLIIDEDRHVPRMDQGERCFRFWLNAGPAKRRLEAVDREALAHNEKPFALSFFPPGGGRKLRPLAVLEDSVVQVTAIKKAERGGDILLRLFNPTSRRRSAKIRLPAIGSRASLRLDPFEIKSLKVSVRTGKIVETDLLEKPLRK